MVLSCSENSPSAYFLYSDFLRLCFSLSMYERVEDIDIAVKAEAKDIWRYCSYFPYY